MKKYLLNALMLSVALLFGTSAQAQVETVTLTSTESAYSYQSEAAVSHNGSKLEHLEVYSTQYRDWGSNDGSVKVNSGGRITFYKFDLTDYKNFGGAIVSATFTFSAIGSGDNKYLQKIRALGYNGEWTAETLTHNNISNNVGTINGKVTDTGTFQPLNDKTEFATGGFSGDPYTFDVNAKTYVESAIQANKDYVSFAITQNSTRVGYYGTSATLKLVVANGTPVNYTLKFVDVENNTEIKDSEIKIGVVDMELSLDEEYKKYFVMDDIRWIFDHSDLDVSKQITSNEESNVYNIYYHKAATYNVTSKAVDESGNVLQEIESFSVLEGEPVPVGYPLYVNYEGTLYTKAANNSTYAESVDITSDGDINLTYKKTDIGNIIYCKEGEQIEGANHVQAGNMAARSSNRACGNISEDVVLLNLPAGNYKATMVCYSNSSAGATQVFYFGAADNYEAKVVGASNWTSFTTQFSLGSDTDIKWISEGSSADKNGLDFIFIQDLGAEHTYKVTAKSEDGKINKILAEGKGYANDANLSIPYARYINVKGTLYEAAAENKSYNHSFNLAEDRDEVVTYKPTSITEVAMFTEGEDIEGITKNTNGNIAIRASQSAAGYAADGEVTVGTIATGGTYKMVAQLAGSGRNGETTFAFAANGTTVLEPVLGAQSNLGSGTSERFSVQDGATITLAQGGDANSAVDYVYVYKAEDFNIAEDAEYFAKSTEQNPNDGVLSNHLIGKDGSTLEVTSDKENAGAIWEDTWQEEVDGNMVDKSFVDLRIQKDGAFIISTSSNSLSLRKIVFTGAALQMTPSDGQFEGQAASRVNKAAPAMVTKTWTGNIDKVKFWADSLVRISTIKLYVEASDGNTATYEEKPRPEKPADKPALEVVANIAAFKALADSTEAKLTLTDAVVTFVNGKNIYLEDATGAIVLYDMGLELTEGQKLNGLLAGKTVNYFALPEMVKTDSTKTDTFTAEAGEVKATTMALADICKVENLARLITISNVTIDVVDNNIFATSGDEKLQVYNKFKVDGLDLQKGNVYTSITGILVPWQNKETLEITYELAPRTLADLVLDADATGISELAGEKAAREVYNLNGQRVNATKKGLYIINGKKVMVK